jgi:hypothetical protein
MNRSRFYDLLIKKLIVRLKADLKVSGTAAFYRFKDDNKEYTLRHHYISKTWHLERGGFDYTNLEYIAKKLAKLLGYAD